MRAAVRPAGPVLPPAHAGSGTPTGPVHAERRHHITTRESSEEQQS
ncbi:hypothetical protein V1460_22200 [Streptomyces sp. SCSIO 30461]